MEDNQIALEPLESQTLEPLESQISTPSVSVNKWNDIVGDIFKIIHKDISFRGSAKQQPHVGMWVARESVKDGTYFSYPEQGLLTLCYRLVDDERRLNRGFRMSISFAFGKLKIGFVLDDCNEHPNEASKKMLDNFVANKKPVYREISKGVMIDWEYVDEQMCKTDTHAKMLYDTALCGVVATAMSKEVQHLLRSMTNYLSTLSTLPNLSTVKS